MFVETHIDLMHVKLLKGWKQFYQKFIILNLLVW